MAKSLEPHEVVNLHSLGLANTVDVVPRKIDKHDVFCAILLGVEQFCAKFLVLYSEF